MRKNCENPRAGAEFQLAVAQRFQRDFERGFILEKKIAVGNPPKDHKQEIYRAINYVQSKLLVTDVSSLQCKIVVTDEFLETINRLHFHPENVYANATTIPPVFQADYYKKSVINDSDLSGKTIILINNKKLTNISPDLFTSVIVHELSHCADYMYRLSGFQDRYGIQMECVKRDTVADVIGGYFSAFSEIRAKYIQEMFVVEHTERSDHRKVFYKNGNSGRSYNFDEITDPTDYYHAQHCAGKIRCWEELFIKNPIDSYCKDEEEIVKRIKKNMLYKHKYNQILLDMYETWDWDLMIKKCDKIFEDYDGRVDQRIS